MIIVREQLPKAEKSKIKWIIEEIWDSYRDFYITKKRDRLFIKENLHLLYETLEKGDKILYDEDKGIILITGFADKAFPRKYVKILAKDVECADKLLQVCLWNFGELNLYCKIKKNNPIKEVLERNGFRIKGCRGLEWLLLRDPELIKLKYANKTFSSKE